MTQKCDIGLMGLAVMGQNLVLNMEDHGFSVAVYNRTTSKMEEFVDSDEVKGKNRKIVGCKTLEELVASLEKPRKVMLMIKSPDAIPALETKLYPEASPIDSVIEQLIGLMDPGDVIIDGGNTQFQDTERRTKCVEAAGLLYIGTGVSGGKKAPDSDRASCPAEAKRRGPW